MAAGMEAGTAFLATYAVSAAELAARGHVVSPDLDRGRILRSVLMKPEAELAVPDLHVRVEALVSQCLTRGAT